MSKKLYVGNLPFSVDSGKLKEIFSEFGEIEEATVIVDKFSNRSKGFGFVTFSNDEDADKAVSGINEKEVEGRNLKVNEARPMEERSEGDRPRRSFGGNRNFGNRDSGRQRRF
jgi:RNA recognition motif-containing protein